MLNWLSSKSRRKKILSYLLIFTAYIGVSIGVTWPLVTELDSAAVGHVGNDTWNHLWGFWWVKYELIDLGQFPLQTDLINHPFGGSLYFIDMANALLSIPLQMAFGLVTSYNLLVIFQLAMNGFGAFLLANYLVRNPYAAFVTGVIYGFSPHLLAQTYNGISETINAGFLPIYMMMFLRAIHEAPKRNALIAGLLLFVNTFFNWYYGLFALLFSGIYLLYMLWRQRSRLLNQATIKRLFMVGLTYSAFILPFLMLFRMSLSAEDALVGRDPKFVWQTLLYHNMTDAMIFFHPGQFYSPDLKAMFGEDLIIVAYLGYISLFLAILATVIMRQRDVNLWVLITGIFFIFSLGPYLYFDGQYVEVSGKWIPLPFLLFFKAVPLFSRISHPFRLVLMVQLGLGILSAFALKAFYARGRHKLASLLGTSLICMAILAESIWASPAKIPLATCPGEIPQFYEQLAHDDEHYAVLDLPVGVPNLRRAVYTYYQTSHKKAVPYSLNEPFPGVLRDNLLMRYMVNLEFAYMDRMPPLMPELDLLMSLETLRADGYRYIVVHNDLFAHENHKKRVHDFLLWFVGNAQRYPEDDIVVYRL